MRRQEWDPRTFFAMHDLNGDSFWDEDEVRVCEAFIENKVHKPRNRSHFQGSHET